MKKLSVRDFEVKSFVTEAKHLRGGAEACTSWPDPACNTLLTGCCTGTVE